MLKVLVIHWISPQVISEPITSRLSDPYRGCQYRLMTDLLEDAYKWIVQHWQWQRWIKWWKASQVTSASTTKALCFWLTSMSQVMVLLYRRMSLCNVKTHKKTSSPRGLGQDNKEEKWPSRTEIKPEEANCENEDKKLGLEPYDDMDVPAALNDMPSFAPWMAPCISLDIVTHPRDEAQMRLEVPLKPDSNYTR